MRTSLSTIAIVSLLLLGTATASARGGVPAADPSGAFDVQGTVISFTAGSRSGLPLLVVDDEISGDEISVALGPAWFLRAAGFAAVPGDFVVLVAYPCSLCAAENVAAWVENTTNGTSVVLRSETGVPLWLGGYHRGPAGENGGGNNGGGNNGGGVSGGGSNGGRGPGDANGEAYRGGELGAGDEPGQGNRIGGTWGLDMTTVTTVTGTVLAIRQEPQSGDPHLRLEVDGSVLKIHLTAQALALIDAAGVLLEPGVELTVTYALTKCSDPAMVALSIFDPVTGLTIQLRDPETGFPLSGFGNRNPR